MRKVSLIFLIIFMVCTISLGEANLFFFQKSSVGKVEPDVRLSLLSGQQKTISEYRNGKKAIVFFWATWCPHCRDYLQDLDKNQQIFLDKGIIPIVVNLAEAKNLVKRFVEKKEIGIDMFLDIDMKLAEEMGLIGVPTFYFIDEQGAIVDVTHSMPKDYEQIFNKGNKSEKEKKG